MRSKFIKTPGIILILFSFFNSINGQLYEWRGPSRTGIYNESGLLKKWPASGPEIIWEAGNMGDGYSSPTVTNDAIYITGRIDTMDVLTSLTLDGRNGMSDMAGHGLITIPDQGALLHILTETFSLLAEVVILYVSDLMERSNGQGTITVCMTANH